MAAFDIELYHKGQQVVTRTGSIVTDIKEITYPGGYVYLTALFGAQPAIWDTDGKFDLIDGSVQDNDLFMDDTTTYKWAVTADLLDTDPSDAAYSMVKIIEAP